MSVIAILIVSNTIGPHFSQFRFNVAAVLFVFQSPRLTFKLFLISTIAILLISIYTAGLNHIHTSI